MLAQRLIHDDIVVLTKSDVTILQHTSPDLLGWFLFMIAEKSMCVETARKCRDGAECLSNPSMGPGWEQLIKTEVVRDLHRLAVG